MPFAQVLEAAVSVRLLREDELRVEGTEPRPLHPAGPRCPGQGRRGLADGTGRGGTSSAGESQGGAGAEETTAADPQAGRGHLPRRRSRHPLRGDRILGRATEAAWPSDSKEKAQESLRVASQGVDDLLTEVADVDLADVPQMETGPASASSRRRKMPTRNS